LADTMVDVMFEESFSGALEEVFEAYQSVPFFKRHMDTAGVHPRDLRTPADLARVPPTSKVDYRRNFPAGVLAQGTTLNDPFVFKSQSSGTTGERLLTIAHTYTLAERMTTTSSAHPGLQQVFAAAKEQRICRYAAPNCSDVECATPNTTPESRTLFDGTRVLPVAHDLLATPDTMVDQAVAETVDYRPHWFYTDPMHMAFLAGNLHRRGIAPPPVGGIVLTYNLVTQSARRQVAEVFDGDCILVEVVSMSELGWMGMECPHGHVHMNSESFYLEFVVDGRPAEPDELAELYVTSIGDRISPHLRYRTGDLYALIDGVCPCGSAFPRVEFHGRSTYTVVRDGAVVLTPKQLDRLVGVAPWLDFYKARQTGPDRLDLRYIPATDAAPQPAAVRALQDQLRVVLGDGMQVTLDAVDYIECERSGKFLPCVSEVDR
jgi:phenylacetate-CoA ligase